MNCKSWASFQSGSMMTSICDQFRPVGTGAPADHAAAHRETVIRNASAGMHRRADLLDEVVVAVVKLEVRGVVRPADGRGVGHDHAVAQRHHFEQRPFMGGPMDAVGRVVAVDGRRMPRLAGPTRDAGDERRPDALRPAGHAHGEHLVAPLGLRVRVDEHGGELRRAARVVVEDDVGLWISGLGAQIELRPGPVHPVLGDGVGEAPEGLEFLHARGRGRDASPSTVRRSGPSTNVPCANTDPLSHGKCGSMSGFAGSGSAGSTRQASVSRSAISSSSSIDRQFIRGMTLALAVGNAALSKPRGGSRV